MTPPNIWQLLLILAIVVLLFGAKKIPELAKGLGSGIKNFKKAVKEDESEVAQSEQSTTIKQSEAKSTQNTTTKQEA